MDTDNPALLFNNKSLTLPPLQSRHIPNFPGLDWVRAFEDPPLILVLTLATLRCLACIALSRLFTAILDKVLTIWANRPPANQVVLEAGNVRIEFCCSGSPVPWEFVAKFAASRRDAVERGVAPVFVREWWWERGEGGAGEGEGGRVCYVGMRVVEGGVRVAVPPFDN